MQPMKLRTRLRRLCFLVSILPVLPAHAIDAQDVRLMIGPNFAVVSEVRPLQLGAGRQMLLLEGIPQEADLSTLVMRTRGDLVKIIEWERLAVEGSGERTFNIDGDAVVWSPAPGETDPTPELPLVRCEIDVPTKGRFLLALTYMVPQLSWHAEYDVALRGEAAGEGEPLSVDLASFVHIKNPSSRHFQEAHITLAAYDPSHTERDARSDPGILLLDESNPLSDFWLEPEQEQQVMFQYTVNRVVDIAADTTTRVPFAEGRRIPAELLYLMTAEQFPIASRDRKQPLKKLIVFRNAERHGLGRALPLGTTQVYLRNRRTRHLERARIPHTAADEEIRIDLGEAEDVFGARFMLGSRNLGKGINIEEYEMAIDNQTEDAIRIEIDEKPPSTLGWDVTRSSASYHVEDGRIRFRPLIKPQRAERIRYSLRVLEPSL